MFVALKRAAKDLLYSKLLFVCWTTAHRYSTTSLLRRSLYFDGTSRGLCLYEESKSVLADKPSASTGERTLLRQRRVCLAGLNARCLVDYPIQGEVENVKISKILSVTDGAIFIIEGMGEDEGNDLFAQATMRS